MSEKVKRPADFFKSMDEVKAYAESIKGKVPNDIYDDILFLLGLEENKAITERVTINGEKVLIDSYISDLVRYFVELDYKPLASCSGLREEHENSRHKPTQGYLAIEYDHMIFRWLFDFFSIDGITIDTGEVFFRPCIIFTVKADNDEEMKILWDKMFEFFKKK